MIPDGGFVVVRGAVGKSEGPNNGRIYNFSIAAREAMHFLRQSTDREEQRARSSAMVD
jgi:hypothetical protein